eukprot:tig00021572_g22405.t1
MLGIFCTAIMVLIFGVFRPAFKKVNSMQKGIVEILMNVPRPVIRAISKHYSRKKLGGAADESDESSSDDDAEDDKAVKFRSAKSIENFADAQPAKGGEGEAGAGAEGEEGAHTQRTDGTEDSETEKKRMRKERKAEKKQERAERKEAKHAAHVAHDEKKRHDKAEQRRPKHAHGKRGGGGKGNESASESEPAGAGAGVQKSASIKRGAVAPRSASMKLKAPLAVEAGEAGAGAGAVVGTPPRRRPSSRRGCGPPRWRTSRRCPLDVLGLSSPPPPLKSALGGRKAEPSAMDLGTSARGPAASHVTAFGGDAEPTHRPRRSSLRAPAVSGSFDVDSTISWTSSSRAGKYARSGRPSASPALGEGIELVRAESREDLKPLERGILERILSGGPAERSAWGAAKNEKGAEAPADSASGEEKGGADAASTDEQAPSSEQGGSAAAAPVVDADEIDKKFTDAAAKTLRRLTFKYVAGFAMITLASASFSWYRLLFS